MPRLPARPRPHALAGLTLALTFVVFPGEPADAADVPTRVIAGPEDQLLPSANVEYLIWAANSVGFPNRFQAYGRRRGTNDAFRLNAPGTRGYAGGIDPGQNRAVYQQIDGRSSDVYAINLATRARSKLPAPINSARWEWGPRVSNAFYLFARDAGTTTTLFLYHRGPQTLEKLVSYDLTTFYAAPGAVGERYATWTVCGPSNCRAFVRDTRFDRTRRIPALDGKARYAPVVDEGEAQVYFVRSGQACGATVRIMRLPLADLGSTPESIATLPPGVDVGFQLSLEVRPDRLDVWFSRYRCGPEQGDVSRLRGV